MVMRTSASAEKTIAQSGFSPDGQVQDGRSRGGGGEEAPGVPGLPGLPGLPGADLLSEFGHAITGGLATAADEPEEPGTRRHPRPAAGARRARRLRGLHLLQPEHRRGRPGRDDLAGRAGRRLAARRPDHARRDRRRPAPPPATVRRAPTSGRAVLGGMTIAGQELSGGPDGFTAAGPGMAICRPFRSSSPTALDQLGIKLLLPEPERTVKGDQATSQVAGLQLDIDVKTLRRQLRRAAARRPDRRAAERPARAEEHPPDPRRPRPARGGDPRCRRPRRSTR